MSSLKIAADMKRFDLLNLADAIRAVELQGASELHFDVADGQFVSTFGFTNAHIAAAKAITKLPCHAHLLVRNPDRCLPDVIASGADIITIQVETCTHLHRALTLIRDHGRQAGVAVLPATSLLKVNYLFPVIQRLVLHCADPVTSRGGLSRAAFERVRILNENIRYHEYAVSLEVEGTCSAEEVARCVRFGADRLVAGPDEIEGFGDASRPDALRQYAGQLDAIAHTV